MSIQNSGDTSLDISEAEDIKLNSNDNPLAKKCLLALPKKGRLQPGCLDIISACGLPFVKNERDDIAYVTNLPIVIVFLNSVDIPMFVGEGNVDIGITGEDVLKESDEKVNILMKLGFGKCKLGLQAPKGLGKTAADAVGSSIVTSFPRITEDYINKLGVISGTSKKASSTIIRSVSGSVEASCKLGLGEFVVDLIETGDTMRAAGLECLDNVMDTEAVLISNPNTRHFVLIEQIRRRIKGYLEAKYYVLLMYNIHEDNMEAAIAVTSGRRSPTVTKLIQERWFSITVMVLKSQVNKNMDVLESLGATDIFSLQITNSR